MHFRSDLAEKSNNGGWSYGFSPGSGEFYRSLEFFGARGLVTRCEGPSTIRSDGRL